MGFIAIVMIQYMERMKTSLLKSSKINTTPISLIGQNWSVPVDPWYQMISDDFLNVTKDVVGIRWDRKLCRGKEPHLFSV